MNRFDTSVNTASTVHPEQYPALDWNMAMVVPDRADNALFSTTYFSGGNQDTADPDSDFKVQVLSLSLNDEYEDPYNAFAGLSTSPGDWHTPDEGTFEWKVEVTIQETEEDGTIEDASEDLQSLIKIFQLHESILHWILHV